MISHEDISYCVVWLFLFHTREPYPRALKVLVEIYGARVPPVPLAAIIAAFFGSVLGKKPTWSAFHSREFANSKFTGVAPSTLLMTI